MEPVNTAIASNEARSRGHGLRVAAGASSPASLEVFDLGTGHIVARWEGPIADRLLESRPLQGVVRGNGSYPCSKELVRQLVLTAAAAELAIRNGVDFNNGRFRSRRTTRTLLHNRILRLLHAHPGHHFSRDDVVCLTLLEWPGVDSRRIRAHLDDIVSWRLVQCIEVDAANVFYDIDVRPRLHIYDEHRRVLTDAPRSGCLRVAGAP